MPTSGLTLAISDNLSPKQLARGCTAHLIVLALSLIQQSQLSADGLSPHGHFRDTKPLRGKDKMPQDCPALPRK